MGGQSFGSTRGARRRAAAGADARAKGAGNLGFSSQADDNPNRLACCSLSLRERVGVRGSCLEGEGSSELVH